MTRIAIVGDGPGGLSAALFLAKNGHEVTVFGTDGTAMNYAFLHNYLGLPHLAGTEFQDIAKAQVTAFGATLIEESVEQVSGKLGGFTVSSASGDLVADYLILTEGRKAPLAESLGLGDAEAGIVVDRDGRSSLDGVYVVGRSVRPTRSQAIISAGDGAAAALDILARESGEDVQDWDTPPKDS